MVLRSVFPGFKEVAKDMLGLQRCPVLSDSVTGRAKSPTRFRVRKQRLILGKDYLIGYTEASCNRGRVLEALQRGSEVYLRESFLDSGNKTGE